MDATQWSHAVLRLLYEEGQPQLTRTYVAYRLGLSGPDAEALLSQMTSDGLLELDSDDEGRLFYRLPASERGRELPPTPVPSPPPAPPVAMPPPPPPQTWGAPPPPAWGQGPPPAGAMQTWGPPPQQASWGPPPPAGGLVASQPTNLAPVSDRSRLVALLLCWFAGCLGVHRFYAGRNGSGLAFLFTFGFLGIGVLVDLILIATGGLRDEHGRPILNWQT